MHYRLDMNTKSTMAILAVVAISAVLIGSVLAEDAMAKKCSRHRGGNGGGFHARCQNVNSQNAGNDIASNTIGNQP
jgi:hypothetical protein